MSDNPYEGPASTLAYSFEAKDWTARNAWVFARIRRAERIDQDLRRALGDFAHEGKEPEATLTCLDRMRGLCDQIEAEIRAIHAHRSRKEAGRETPDAR